LPPPTAVQGVDLLRSFSRDVRRDRAAFSDVGWFEKVSLRTAKWKYVRPRSEKLEVKLFDLETDPAEQYNVFDERPDVASSLDPQLRQWMYATLPKVAAAEEPELDPAVKQRLRDLGYMQ